MKKYILSTLVLIFFLLPVHAQFFTSAEKCLVNKVVKIKEESYEIKSKTDFDLNNEKAMLHIESTYDNNGDLIEETEFDINGSIESYKKCKHIYNSKGKKAQIFIYDKNGKMTDKWDFIYDGIGNKIGAKVFDSNNGLQTRFDYKNDSHGNCIETIQYDKLNSIIFRITYIYDELNRQIEIRSFKKDNLVIVVKMIYEKNHNNAIEVQYYDPKNILLKKNHYQYTFDSKFNWIKCIAKSGTEKIENDYIAIREIVYR